MMTATHAITGYTLAAGILFVAQFIADVLDGNCSRERFARQLLGAVVWPLMLLWWARPSWLWREQTEGAITKALREEVERLRVDLSDAVEMLKACRDEIARLKAEREGFR